MLGQAQGKGRSAAALTAAPSPLAPRSAASPLDPGSSRSSSISQLDTPMTRRTEQPVSGSDFAGMAAAAPAPAPATADGSAHGGREGSVHRSISIHADGSAHGGRRYFDGQAEGQQRRDHLAVWMIEDGSAAKAGDDAPQQQQQQREGSTKAGDATPVGNPPCSCCGCTCGGGAGGGDGGPPANGGAGRRKGDFGPAKVVIEEADERKLFDWGTYFSSLPKKLKGGSKHTQPGPECCRQCGVDCAAAPRFCLLHATVSATLPLATR